MTAVTAATWVFAVLLAVAGARKITEPSATGAALQGARLPSWTPLVRLLGAGEIALAAAVLLRGGRWPAAALAVAYGAFAVFAWRQSRRGAGCGCFGQSDAPATNVHVAVDTLGAVAGVMAAVGYAPSLVQFLGGGMATAVLAVVLLATAAAVVQLALTALPELAAAVALHRAEESS